MSSQTSPCAACKLLRRKCTQECVFAPYFPPDNPVKFSNVHKVFGASNVSKLLNDLETGQREDAVNSLAYEAEYRLRDPVYGCVGLISVLQHKLLLVKNELMAARKELATYVGPSALMPMIDPVVFGGGGGGGPTYNNNMQQQHHHQQPMMGVPMQQQQQQYSHNIHPQQQQQMMIQQELTAIVAASEQREMMKHQHQQQQYGNVYNEGVTASGYNGGGGEGGMPLSLRVGSYTIPYQLNEQTQSQSQQHNVNVMIQQQQQPLVVAVAHPLQQQPSERSEGA